MTEELRTPEARECERCGRRERWDEADESWRIDREGDDPRVGDPHCIHEWDINGSFAPFDR